MTIPLQRFPYLALKEIILGMEFDNIFWLSLTSRKTCRIVQALNFNRVSSIRYYMHYAGITLSIKTLGAKVEQPIVGLTEVPVRIYIENEMMTLKIGGIEKQFYKDWRSFCFLFFDAVPQGTMNDIFVNHLQSFFRHPLPIDLFVDARRRFATAYQPIEGVRSLKLKIRATDRRALDYIAQYQNLNSLEIHGKLTNDFNVRLPNLFVVNAAEHGKRILENFDGRNLVLSETSLSSADVSKFVKKWKKSKAFHNLESVELRLAGGEIVFEENQVLRGIEVAEGVNRPVKYTPFYGDQTERSTERFRDIVRSADEKRASIQVTSAKFLMVIWQ